MILHCFLRFSYTNSKSLGFKYKLKEGYKEEQCLDAIRTHFKEYNSKTIKEITKDVFEGSEEDWNTFVSTARYLYTKCFLKAIMKLSGE